MLYVFFSFQNESEQEIELLENTSKTPTINQQIGASTNLVCYTYKYFKFYQFEKGDGDDDTQKPRCEYCFDKKYCHTYCYESLGRFQKVEYTSHNATYQEFVTKVIRCNGCGVDVVHEFSCDECI